MKRFISILAVCCLLLGLMAGCNKENADYAIKVGDKIVTENDYARHMSLLRSNYLSANGAEDTAEYWKDYKTSEITHSDYLVETANLQLINTKLYSLQFDKLGLVFGEEEQSKINASLSEMTEAQGGMSAFISDLQKYGYTYEEYLEEFYDVLKKSKVLNHYYGEDGEDPVSVKDIKDYYNVHNALVKAVYILKVDQSTGESLPKEELAAAKQRAEEAYEAATRPSDTDLFEDVISIFSDAKNQTEAVVISDNGSFADTLYKPALALEVGEVALLDLDTAYMVIKRYDGTAEDVFTSTLQQATLEEIRAEEIDELLTLWKDETKIKINHKLIKKYRPENTVGA